MTEKDKIEERLEKVCNDIDKTSELLELVVEKKARYLEPSLLQGHIKSSVNSLCLGKNMLQKSHQAFENEDFEECLKWIDVAERHILLGEEKALSMSKNML